MKMEQTDCSETSAYKIQTPGNYPEENIQHLEHGESLKSRIICTSFEVFRNDISDDSSLLEYDAALMGNRNPTFLRQYFLSKRRNPTAH
jgi:hypothetical protein